MEAIYAKARAKINLNLLVLNKRKDNYHNLKSIFQKINLYDEIYIHKTLSDNMELYTNIEELNNENNIVYKAYVMLKERYKNITGIKVTINKKIPMQAGMAGGSTDCASFILCMNKLFDLKMTKKEIEEIAKSLGADVVPCLYNKALLAEGIGDKVTPIDTNFKYYVLVIKPQVHGNTKEMYQRIDTRNDVEQIDNTDKIIKALKEKNIKLFKDNLYNVFEIAYEKIIENIKNELKLNGAINSLMTGSGSCVFGLFENKQIAKNVYNKLKNKHEIYICTSYNSIRRNYFDR